MYPISDSLIEAMQSERRAEAAEYRRAKALRMAARSRRRERRRPAPLAHLLRRIAIS